jgi:hypothetical protein
VTDGSISVAGRGDICDAAQARIVPGPWRALRVEGGCIFSGELPARAGGWYAVEVRVLRKGVLSEHARVEHVGVGEVFVIAGQSNAANYGEELQQTKSGMVSAFSGREWRLANDPQPGVQDRSGGGSFLPAFGDALYARYSVPIGVTTVAFGGTSVRQWLPAGGRFRIPPVSMRNVLMVAENDWASEGRLFDGMLERIRQLGPHGFRALLWHQGEADANQEPAHAISGADYRRMLERIIRESRTRAGWDFPWFVAQATYHSALTPSSPEIRAAQASLWTSGLALEGPDTDRLGSEYRANGGRDVHFNARGLAAHGQAWADKVATWLDQILAGSNY